MYHLNLAPADPILGLNDAFNADPRSDKINLGVGVYKDAMGRTPIMTAVKAAEGILLNDETTKSYLGITGNAALPALAQALLLGNDHPLLGNPRVKTAQAPGGTGALRVAADFIAKANPGATVWVSNPTWANHNAIFEAAGLTTAVYRYYDASTQSLDEAGLLEDLQGVAANDVVVLHGCCHNPSGVDPSAQTWAKIADIAANKGWMPLVDFAYQGFGAGIDADRQGLLELLKKDLSLLVAASFSKNFGLYNERIGALTLIDQDAATAEAAFSHIKLSIRANYSNPPAHGGAIVATVLGSSELRNQWETELTQMRERIADMRTGLTQGLAARGVDRDFSFIQSQNGMFSFAGISPEQVDRLRSEFGVYAVRSGRINVAAITPTNLDPLCDAIAAVL
ncbi:aminotransferase class I/II-fold pyridoxal phosphate-dependent enzyme [Litorivicinus lipolyticus]|uniref:Aminotransferase n=1 Tax=Litorivicinus lipolyticus TaxID=418701 RepID=A0A5Q2QBT1_9GAMM|nr:amino acid aminotransferase [Litorivicinus lipolyticus]QGG79447.1 aminotransferase class I/II-fold pyridoxal phosphate-dependent enzyme [Litorivicinus lipolyticus]